MSSPALKKSANEAPILTAAPIAQSQGSPQTETPKKSPPIRRIILGAIALIALGVVVNYGYHYIAVGRFQISTDDAYVKADTSVLSAKVAGLVTETPVLNNTPVKAGDVVLRLDGKDYELAIAAAKSKLATQQAALGVFAKQKIAQAAQIGAAQAQVQSAKAVELNAAQTQQRASQMVKTNVGTQQALDDANRARDTAQAGVTAAESNVAAAQAQLGVLGASEQQATSLLAELQVAVDKAEHDLSFAEIRAPFDGVIANRAVAPGQFVQPGSNLMALVPIQKSFITANFKETQLVDIHPGQKVEVNVDALKRDTFEGVVDSISPASGAEFSLLPPDNATGNFTKITQRFPVKILLPPEVSLKLRPGQSVSVSVDTRDKGSN